MRSFDPHSPKGSLIYDNEKDDRGCIIFHVWHVNFSIFFLVQERWHPRPRSLSFHRLESRAQYRANLKSIFFFFHKSSLPHNYLNSEITFFLCECMTASVRHVRFCPRAFAGTGDPRPGAGDPSICGVNPPPANIDFRCKVEEALRRPGA